jgi:hypothetical protein
MSVSVGEAGDVLLAAVLAQAAEGLTAAFMVHVRPGAGDPGRGPA